MSDILAQIIEILDDHATGDADDQAAGFNKINDLLDYGHEGLTYEYRLEMRYKTLPSGEQQDWHDASGYNKDSSVYTSLSAIKGVITQTRKWYSRPSYQKYFTDLEFRVLRRPVNPLPWEEIELG